MSMNQEGTASQLIVQDQGDGVVLVQLNRPQVRNALNMTLRRELAAEFQVLNRRQDLRCVVLTGNETAFCAGADLREYQDATTIEVLQRNLDQLWSPLVSCPVPVIAAVQGYALGGGCELAMHADIIIAGESARFGQPEVRVGLMPGSGATQRLTRVVGKFVAMKMLLTGQPMTATQALASGLVSAVVPDTSVLSESLNLAGELARLAPLAVRQIKELVLESMNSSLDSGLRMERKAFQILFASTDKTEGINAFLEKRSPVFTGR